MNDKQLYAGKTYDDVIDEFSDTVTRMCALHCSNIEDVKDCYQNVFLKLYLSTTEFENVNHLRSWLIKVAITTSLDCVKQYWHKNVLLHGNDKESMQMIDALSLKQKGNTNEDLYEQSSGELLSDIFQLPVKYRQVIFLYYYEEYSLSEISKILNITEGTIKSQLARGRKLLKKKIELDDSYISKGGINYENINRV